MKKNRISDPQKDILYTMYAFYQRRGNVFIPCPDLYKIINDNGDRKRFSNNFRESCWALEEQGLLKYHRQDRGTGLSFALTEKGIMSANIIFLEREIKSVEAHK